MSGVKATRDTVRDHVAWLNALRWVRFSGRPYIVVERDGVMTFARSGSVTADAAPAPSPRPQSRDFFTEPEDD